MNMIKCAQRVINLSKIRPHCKIFFLALTFVFTIFSFGNDLHNKQQLSRIKNYIFLRYLLVLAHQIASFAVQYFAIRTANTNYRD